MYQPGYISSALGPIPQSHHDSVISNGSNSSSTSGSVGVLGGTSGPFTGIRGTVHALQIPTEDGHNAPLLSRQRYKGRELDPTSPEALRTRNEKKKTPGLMHSTAGPGNETKEAQRVVVDGVDDLRVLATGVLARHVEGLDQPPYRRVGPKCQLEETDDFINASPDYNSAVLPVVSSYGAGMSSGSAGGNCYGSNNNNNNNNATIPHRAVRLDDRITPQTLHALLKKGRVSVAKSKPFTDTKSRYYTFAPNSAASKDVLRRVAVEQAMQEEAMRHNAEKTITTASVRKNARGISASAAVARRQQNQLLAPVKPNSTAAGTSRPRGRNNKLLLKGDTPSDFLRKYGAAPGAAAGMLPPAIMKANISYLEPPGLALAQGAQFQVKLGTSGKDKKSNIRQGDGGNTSDSDNEDDDDNDSDDDGASVDTARLVSAEGAGVLISGTTAEQPALSSKPPPTPALTYPPVPVWYNSIDEVKHTRTLRRLGLDTPRGDTIGVLEEEEEKKEKEEKEKKREETRKDYSARRGGAEAIRQGRTIAARAAVAAAATEQDAERTVAAAVDDQTQRILNRMDGEGRDAGGEFGAALDAPAVESLNFAFTAASSGDDANLVQQLVRFYGTRQLKQRLKAEERRRRKNEPRVLPPTVKALAAMSSAEGTTTAAAGAANSVDNDDAARQRRLETLGNIKQGRGFHLYGDNYAGRGRGREDEYALEEAPLEAHIADPHCEAPFSLLDSVLTVSREYEKIERAVTAHGALDSSGVIAHSRQGIVARLTSIESTRVPQQYWVTTHRRDAKASERVEVPGPTAPTSVDAMMRTAALRPSIAGESTANLATAGSFQVSRVSGRSFASATSTNCSTTHTMNNNTSISASNTCGGGSGRGTTNNYTAIGSASIAAASGQPNRGNSIFFQGGVEEGGGGGVSAAAVVFPAPRPTGRAQVYLLSETIDHMLNYSGAALEVAATSALALGKEVKKAKTADGEVEDGDENVFLTPLQCLSSPAIAHRILPPTTTELRRKKLAQQRRQRARLIQFRRMRAMSANRKKSTVRAAAAAAAALDRENESNASGELLGEDCSECDDGSNDDDGGGGVCEGDESAEDVLNNSNNSNNITRRGEKSEVIARVELLSDVDTGEDGEDGRGYDYSASPSPGGGNHRGGSEGGADPERQFEEATNPLLNEELRAEAEAAFKTYTAAATHVLGVLDIGFSEVVRQVASSCVERGAMLDALRQSVIDIATTTVGLLGSTKERAYEEAERRLDLRRENLHLLEELEKSSERLVEAQRQQDVLRTENAVLLSKATRLDELIARVHEKRRRFELHGEEEHTHLLNEIERDMTKSAGDALNTLFTEKMRLCTGYSEDEMEGHQVGEAPSAMAARRVVSDEKAAKDRLYEESYALLRTLDEAASAMNTASGALYDKVVLSTVSPRANLAATRWAEIAKRVGVHEREKMHRQRVFAVFSDWCRHYQSEKDAAAARRSRSFASSNETSCFLVDSSSSSDLSENSSLVLPDDENVSSGSFTALSGARMANAGRRSLMYDKVREIVKREEARGSGASTSSATRRGEGGAAGVRRGMSAAEQALHTKLGSIQYITPDDLAQMDVYDCTPTEINAMFARNFDFKGYLNLPWDPQPDAWSLNMFDVADMVHDVQIALQEMTMRMAAISESAIMRKGVELPPQPPDKPEDACVLCGRRDTIGDERRRRQERMQQIATEVQRRVEELTEKCQYAESEREDARGDARRLTVELKYATEREESLKKQLERMMEASLASGRAVPLGRQVRGGGSATTTPLNSAGKKHATISQNLISNPTKVSSPKNATGTPHGIIKDSATRRRKGFKPRATVQVPGSVSSSSIGTVMSSMVASPNMAAASSHNGFGKRRTSLGSAREGDDSVGTVPDETLSSTPTSSSSRRIVSGAVSPVSQRSRRHSGDGDAGESGDDNAASHDVSLTSAAGWHSNMNVDVEPSNETNSPTAHPSEAAFTTDISDMTSRRRTLPPPPAPPSRNHMKRRYKKQRSNSNSECGDGVDEDGEAKEGEDVPGSPISTRRQRQRQQQIELGGEGNISSDGLLSLDDVKSDDGEEEDAGRTTMPSTTQVPPSSRRSDGRSQDPLIQSILNSGSQSKGDGNSEEEY